MKSEWIQAGFYLIKEAVPPPRDRQFLPPRIITASECIVDVYPGFWAIKSAETPPEELAKVREELKLTESEFADLRSWMDLSMASSDLGWPNLFLNLRAAREFKRRFMNAVPGVHLIGLVIAADDAEEFMSDPSYYGPSGMLEIVSRQLPPEEAGVFLGFDVLGVEYGGDSLHTFSCNGLERDYAETLGMTFNAYGLIPDQDQALAAAEYTNRDETAAEPVPWFAVKLYEFDLVNPVPEVSGGV